MHPERFWNTSDVSTYVENLEAGQLPRGGKEALSRRQMMTEAVFLGLRTIEGIDVQQFDQRFGAEFRDLFAKPLEEFQEKKLLELSEHRCRLTREGLLLLDAIAASFADHLPD
jgi:oxygen-independent coproporphyrinogen-3 oxidase